MSKQACYECKHGQMEDKRYRNSPVGRCVAPEPSEESITVSQVQGVTLYITGGAIWLKDKITRTSCPLFETKAYD